MFKTHTHTPPLYFNTSTSLKTLPYKAFFLAKFPKSASYQIKCRMELGVGKRAGVAVRNIWI